MAKDIVQEILDRNKDKSEGDLLSDIYSKVDTKYEFSGPAAFTVNMSNNVLDNKPRKKVKKIGDQDVVSEEDDLPMYLSNAPYRDTYRETDNVLKGAILQLDILANDVKGDLDDIRSSKTMKRKYDFITGLTSSISTIIGSKISAARELNNTIKNSHELEMKRVKEMKLGVQVDDAKAIMDTYNAFVSMPISANPVTGYSSPLGPNTSDLTLMHSGMMSHAIGMDPEIGYSNYLNTMSPEQSWMLHESNPDVKQVVLYDPATGATQFKMMNTRTREYLNIPSRDNSFLGEGQTTLDLNNLRARNVNLDESYDIVVVDSSNGGMGKY